MGLNDVPAVKKFLSQQVDIDAWDPQIKDHPLYSACASGSVEIAQLLIDHGANVNLVKNPSATPLIAATIQHEVNEEMVRLLLKAGANPNLPEGNPFKSPLMAAANGANLTLMKLLIEAGADVNYANAKGETVLLAAASNYKDRLAAVQLLFDHGATIGTDAAIMSQLLGGAARWGDVELLELLVKHGANLERAPEDSRHAVLGNAIYAGRADAVRFVLDLGMYVDTDVALALDVVAQHPIRSAELVNVLLDAGAEETPTYLAWSGFQMAKEKQYDKAIDFLNRALEKTEPERGRHFTFDRTRRCPGATLSVYAALGVAYAHVGKKAEAANAWKQCLAHWPKDSLAVPIYFFDTQGNPRLTLWRVDVVDLIINPRPDVTLQYRYTSRVTHSRFEEKVDPDKETGFFESK